MELQNVALFYLAVFEIFVAILKKRVIDCSERLLAFRGALDLWGLTCPAASYFLLQSTSL
jgi:hypothetical protein